jgi:hypothetical protein
VQAISTYIGDNASLARIYEEIAIMRDRHSGNVSRHVTTEKKCVWGQKLGLPQVDPICTNQNPHGSWKLHEASQMSHVDTQNLAEQVIEHHQSIIRLIEMDESTPNPIRLVGGLKLGGIWMKLSATRVM